ncbi:thiol-disulfide oxidoreductase DCC family protein [Aurantiacibacter aquimixticola]|uniref:Thiol-disulfide oxidoreductase DCC family protein n=1 Tax=Aurantiacibacter aquimixticola TaxID=1958945 RepID=A0A419RRN2_9SPHN|nr:thiol-disulfide oxidoreductase DCC family protein [Aurantiacibacter aquimixticola]RJY08426.1 thiol-disulfide oxidoreductase DCC family protein [Aurantiacibacter aquimixticola]
MRGRQGTGKGQARAEDAYSAGRTVGASGLSALPDGPIILFDAECVLCSANAEFILTHDRAERFHLASMQGDVGAALFRRHGIDPQDPETLLLVDGDRVLKNSDAVLAIWYGLGWPWKMAGLARIVPRAIRDPVYRLVARNRYRWFGKRKMCWMAPPEYRSRVL